MSATRRASDSFGVAAGLGVLYVVWGSTYLAQRVAVTGFPPLRMAGLRFTVSGALLYAVLRARGAPRPSRRAWCGALLSALPLIVMGMGGIAVAVERVPSGLVALVMGSVPLWIALFDRVWGGRLATNEIAGALVGAAGVLLVSLRGALHTDAGAAAIAVLAAASYALGCVLTRRLTLPDGILAAAAQMLTGGLVLLAESAARGERPSTPTAQAVGALAYVTIFGTLLGYSILGWLLRHARPALATSYTYVNPVIALALGATLGNESITSADVAGLVLVIVAVALIALGRGEAPRPAEAPANPSA